MPMILSRLLHRFPAYRLDQLMELDFHALFFLVDSANENNEQRSMG